MTDILHFFDNEMDLCILLDLYILFQDSIQKDWCVLSFHVGFMCPAVALFRHFYVLYKGVHVHNFVGGFNGFLCVCFQAPKDLCGPDRNCSGTLAVLWSSLSLGSLNRKSKQMSRQCRDSPNSVLICHIVAVWLRASEPHVSVISVLRKWSSASKRC